MVPGIDPCVDFAFKKVFGSESTRGLLLHLVNAVLQGSPQVVALELLNPLQRTSLGGRQTLHSRYQGPRSPGAAV